MSEDVKITIESYAAGKGVMDIHATGISPEDCTKLAFTKSGQVCLLAPRDRHTAVPYADCCRRPAFRLSRSPRVA